MPVYKVVVEWAVFSEVEVAANSLNEAILDVEYNDSLVPSDGTYIDGSLVINRDMTYYLNKSSIS